MYCNACGSEVNATARFCPQCGRALPQAAASGLQRRRPLERPRQGRKIAGVCLALANHFDMDVTAVRILWVVFTVLFAVAFGAVAYVAAWILIPEEPQPLEVLQAVPGGGAVSGPGAPSA